jgi:hypothetical protein
MEDTTSELANKYLSGDIVKEIRKIPFADRRVKYDRLDDKDEMSVYDSKIKGLREDITEWKKLADKERTLVRRNCTKPL